jgi:purine nucleosidase
MEKRHFWIDTDTASDDAVAILMALLRDDILVEGIGVVSGNVPVEQGCRNALYVVELAGRTTPVYRGASRPLLRAVRHATQFHGPDGMGGMGYMPRRGQLQGQHAVEAFIARAETLKERLTLVTLGPLTNIAMALTLEPELARWVSRCYLMGGAACTVGNVTPAAEYNIWCDPEAAELVLRSGLPILLVGWEHCRGEANLLSRDIEQLKSLDSPLADFVVDCNRTALSVNRERYHDPGIPLPDPLAMAIALEERVCVRREKHYVSISLDEELTRGMTVVDKLHVTGKTPNVEVCWEIDIAAWKQVLFRDLGRKRP